MEIITKKQYNLNAIVLTAIGLGSLAFGISMFLSPKQTVNENALKGEKFTQCQSAAALANMGASSDIRNNKVTILSSDLNNFKATFAAASFVVSECEGFEMKEMCFGTSCSSNGLVMELEYKGNADEKDSIKSKIRNSLKNN